MASPPVQESDLSGFVRALTPRLTAKIKEGQELETAEDRFKMALFYLPQCPKYRHVGINVHILWANPSCELNIQYFSKLPFSFQRLHHYSAVGKEKY